MKNKFSAELKQLYLQTSKHSNYQVLAPELAELITDRELDIQTRHEKSRWAYITKQLDFNAASVVDVGGNTGFFSFSALDAGARYVQYFEGNKAHAKFVSLAAQLAKYNGHLDVHNQYIDLETQALPEAVDIMFLLNVLHHIGDDYGNRQNNAESALLHIENVLKQLAGQTSLLVFQLGFNWKGDVSQPLFRNGTKTEVIEFIKRCTDGHWELVKVGVAEKSQGIVHYEDLNESNLVRDDELGEFLNRPIFILKSNLTF